MPFRALYRESFGALDRARSIEDSDSARLGQGYLWRRTQGRDRCLVDLINIFSLVYSIDGFNVVGSVDIAVSDVCVPSIFLSFPPLTPTGADELHDLRMTQVSHKLDLISKVLEIALRHLLTG